MSFSEDYALKSLHLSDGIIGEKVELIIYSNRIIRIGHDVHSGGRGEDLGVTPSLKWSWVEVPTDIEPPLPPHLIVDRGDTRHKGG